MNRVPFSASELPKPQEAYSPVHGPIGLEGKSNFYAYKALGDPDHMNLEKVFQERANRQVQEKRQQEEMKVLMQEWSEAKARITEEASFKQER